MPGKEERLTELLAPTVESLGFELWGLELLSPNRRPTLRVFIESSDGVTVDNCADVSRHLGGVLDVEDPIAGEYTLEVSSPGVDRLLFKPVQYGGPAQIAALEANGFVELDEAGKKCWKGYKKVGTQKLFGKTYNRCVKEGSFTIDPKAHNKEKRAAKIGNLARNTSNPGEKAAAEKKAKGPKLYGENITIEDANGNTFAEVIDVIKPEPLVSNVEEAVRIPSKTGSIISTTLTWRGKILMIKMFFPQTFKPSRSDVQDQIQKVYPGSRLNSYFISDFKPGEQLLHVSEGAAWTKKSGKSESGGLNEKGRKSYERENPGSDLKAPSKKVGNPRRASFCARMKGMKKKLTSKKTANDPDSRINKSLRAWNC